MSFFQEFRTETKLLLVVALAAIIIAVGGILLLRTISPSAPERIPETEQVQQTQETNVDWTGVYEYVEFAEGIGSNQTWVYTLEIYKDQEELKTNLNIDGWQTLTRIQATAQEHNGSLDIVFDSYAPENATLRGLQKGDLLFSLKRLSDSEYEILWGEMESNLFEPGRATFTKQSSSIDTSGWQTYRNDEYGFEVKYPPHLVVYENSDRRFHALSSEIGTEIDSFLL